MLPFKDTFPEPKYCWMEPLIQDIMDNCNIGNYDEYLNNLGQYTPHASIQSGLYSIIFTISALSTTATELSAFYEVNNPSSAIEISLKMDIPIYKIVLNNPLLDGKRLLYAVAHRLDGKI